MTFDKILLTLVAFCCGVAAQAQFGAEIDVTSARPNAGGAPDEITVTLGLLDIAQIDDRNQVFVADIFFEVAWQDARLVSSDGVRTVALGEIWDPRLSIINNRGVDRLLPDVATVDSQGNVVYRQRIWGPLAVDFDLRDLPFDTQRLPIQIVSYQYSGDEIVFSGASELVARMDTLGGDGWTYSILEPQSSIYRLREEGRGGAQLTFPCWHNARRLTTF